MIYEDFSLSFCLFKDLGAQTKSVYYMNVGTNKGQNRVGLFIQGGTECNPYDDS